jgi:hypothetical protein
MAATRRGRRALRLEEEQKSRELEEFRMALFPIKEMELTGNLIGMCLVENTPLSLLTEIHLG